MTKRLDTVIDKLRQLPDSDQNALAERLDAAIDALRSDRKWYHLLDNSADTLVALADEARAAEEAGETEEMTFESLRRGS
jgi:hypothetical protein